MDESLEGGGVFVVGGFFVVVLEAVKIDDEERRG